MLHDTDAIGFVTNKIIEADLNYREDKGASPGTLRYTYARNAISLLNRDKFRQTQIVYEYVNSGKAPNLKTKNYDIERIEQREEIKHLLNIANISDRYKLAIERRFLHNDTYREIAVLLNVSKQRAQQLVQVGIKKLRKVVSSQT